MYEARNSVYCYPDTNTLVNKLNIKDPVILSKYEKSIVAIKLIKKKKKGITGNFDLNHFVSIHKFLFEDIYNFAGLFRNENIAKDFFQFAQWEYIEDELVRLLNNLKKENYLYGLGKSLISSRIAFYWAELNVLHPFREGNGRTTREFLRQLLLKNNFVFNLKNVNSQALLDASIKSIVDTSYLEELLNKCIEPK